MPHVVVKLLSGRSETQKHQIADEGDPRRDEDRHVRRGYGLRGHRGCRTGRLGREGLRSRNRRQGGHALQEARVQGSLAAPVERAFCPHPAESLRRTFNQHSECRSSTGHKSTSGTLPVPTICTSRRSAMTASLTARRPGSGPSWWTARSMRAPTAGGAHAGIRRRFARRPAGSRPQG